MSSYILGGRPYKRFIKGPCIITGRTGIVRMKLIVGEGDVADTKGMTSKKRKDCLVTLGAV